MKFLFFLMFGMSIYYQKILQNHKNLFHLALKQSNKTLQNILNKNTRKLIQVGPPPNQLAAAPQINDSRIIVHQYEPPHTPIGDLSDQFKNQHEPQIYNIHIKIPPPN